MGLGWKHCSLPSVAFLGGDLGYRLDARWPKSYENSDGDMSYFSSPRDLGLAGENME